jgi:hypothetical protein
LACPTTVYGGAAWGLIYGEPYIPDAIQLKADGVSRHLTGEDLNMDREHFG